MNLEFLENSGGVKSCQCTTCQRGGVHEGKTGKESPRPLSQIETLKTRNERLGKRSRKKEHQQAFAMKSSK